MYFSKVLKFNSDSVGERSNVKFCSCCTCCFGRVGLGTSVSELSVMNSESELLGWVSFLDHLH